MLYTDKHILHRQSHFTHLITVGPNLACQSNFKTQVFYFSTKYTSNLAKL